MLTTRDLTAEGLGQKNRGWNQTIELLDWRRGWAEVTNEHLAHAGLGVRIDHRSYQEQLLDLIPGRKIGLGVDRQQDQHLPSFLADRVAEQAEIMRANGTQIIADPKIALKALTHGQATFTHHDIARFLNTRTDSAEQFQRALLKVTTSPELVGLGLDDQGRQRSRAQRSLDAAYLADQEAGRWRQAHGIQTKLHDAGVRKADYLVEREIAQAEATRARAEAIKALKTAEQELKRVRTEAVERLTRETAPARAKAAELEGLARAAHEREEMVREFERLAHDRATGRKEYQDASPDWQAMPPALRQTIDDYNRAPPEAQDKIRKLYSTQAVLTQSLKQTLQQRRELTRDLDQDLSL